MSWDSRKSRRALPVALAAAVTGTILLGVAGGSPADAATSRPGLVQSLVDNGCSPDYPHRVNFFSNGALVPDLTVCTNWLQSATTITNTSDSVVWHVNQPSLPYWTLNEDSSSSLSDAVLLFRTWINAVVSSPYLTIEPGVAVTIYTSPDQIQLGHNAGEQATWQVMHLLAGSIADKGRQTFIDILKDSASPTGKAVIECANDAYSIGQSLYGADQSQDIQSQLSTGLGIYQNTASCAQAIDESQHAAESYGESPLLTLESIQKEAHVNEEWNATDKFVGEAVEFIKMGEHVRA
jgi:hypothetical protein